METEITEITTLDFIYNDKCALKIRDLWHLYRSNKGNITSLKGINLDIREGELLAIAGPNGSGKSTLIKHFNGLIDVQRGSIDINGERITKKNKKLLRKQIGLVFQNPEEQIFYPVVYDDIAFGPRNMHLSEEQIRKKVEHALEEAQIGHLRNRSTFALSYGEKKRVAFAGILALDPKIIVLDEPTVGVDPWAKPSMINTILNFRKHHTVVLVTHDLNLLKIAERIALLWEGKLRGIFDSYEDFYHSAFADEDVCCH